MTNYTSFIAPPPISQRFDGNLLRSTLQRILHNVDKNIKPLAKKKIKGDHIGRRRQFIILLMKFNEAYERKKVEEINYQAEVKEKVKKRPYIPTTGGTCTFRRLRSSNGLDE